jgi:hypothetical protein
MADFIDVNEDDMGGSVEGEGGAPDAGAFVGGNNDGGMYASGGPPPPGMMGHQQQQHQPMAGGRQDSNESVGSTSQRGMGARNGSVDSAGTGGSSSRPAPLEHQPSAATLAWRSEQEQRAKRKDVENEKKRKEMEAAAQAKLEGYKAERAKKQATTLAANKEAQKKIAAVGLTGTTWAKVAALCELDKEVPDREKMRLLIKSRAKEG